MAFLTYILQPINECVATFSKIELLTFTGSDVQFVLPFRTLIN